jgi:glucosamine-6-phosphate deaminase
VYGKLRVRVYQDRQALGEAAGLDVGATLMNLLQQQERVRMVFAAAPSQEEFLQALAQVHGIDWSRVTAFQMDEYLGLAPQAPQRFGQFLAQHLFDLVNPGDVHLIDTTNDAAVECARYSALLHAAPIDIVCLGIGENGHLAFNEPSVADFHDPLTVKLVELEPMSRLQQVHDGCFSDLAAVPTQALTLTVPALLSGNAQFCSVPGAAKRAAVAAALSDPISPLHPASILRDHPNCVLYLDHDSYGS